MDNRPYTIYYIVGIKVGCTRELERRTQQNRKIYGDKIKIETLEVLSPLVGAKYAGDREHWWADRLGYRRANHYSQRWDSQLSKEQLSEISKLAKAAF
jgi:hypothetical protein